MDSYARAVVAGQKPQLNWALSKTEGMAGSAKVSSWQAGVSVSYSLFNGFSDKAASMAATKRAESARQQLAELLASKFARTAEIYDIATTSLERAKRYVDVLRDSERVRNFTFQQWSQLGKRSLFDVMSAESDHFGLRIAYVNSLHDGFAARAQMRSMGAGLTAWLMPEQKP
jgi:adhesin transport system outer membrane protein